MPDQRCSGAKRLLPRYKGHVLRRMFADLVPNVYVLVDGDAAYDPPSAPCMIGASPREVRRSADIMRRPSTSMGRRKDHRRHRHICSRRLHQAMAALSIARCRTPTVRDRQAPQADADCGRAADLGIRGWVDHARIYHVCEPSFANVACLPPCDKNQRSAMCRLSGQTGVRCPNEDFRGRGMERSATCCPVDLGLRSDQARVRARLDVGRNTNEPT